MRDEIDMMRTAVHEAAHAVVAHVLGGRVLQVVVHAEDRDDGLLGFMRPFYYEPPELDDYDPSYDDPNCLDSGADEAFEALDLELAEYYDKEILVSLAGPVATAQYRGWSFEKAVENGGYFDFASVKWSMEMHPRPDTLDDYIARTRQLVDQHWRTIIRVAKELMRNPDMTGEQFKAALEGNLEGRVPLVTTVATARSRGWR